MDIKELKLKSVAELQKLLKSEREKVRDLRFRIANRQLKNMREIRVIKKGVAQILTVLNKDKNQPAAKQ